MTTIGIDLGGTNLRACVVKEESVLAWRSVATRAERGGETLISDMAELCIQVLDKAGVPLGEVASIGVGSTGTIEAKKGEIVCAHNLGLYHFDLAARLKNKMQRPVYMANDASCAAVGEYFAGAGRVFPDCLVLTFGTGVGGGYVEKGKLFGDEKMGMELGHTALIAGGEKCSCGRRGCLEAYASGTALARQAQRAMEKNRGSLLWKLCGNDSKKVDAKLVFTAAGQGDKLAGQLVETYISYMAEGVADYINIFRPSVVLIGGGVANAGEGLLLPLRRKVKDLTYGHEYMEQPPIVQAGLLERAGMVGAALLYKIREGGPGF